MYVHFIQYIKITDPLLERCLPVHMWTLQNKLAWWKKNGSIRVTGSFLKIMEEHFTEHKISSKYYVDGIYFNLYRDDEIWLTSILSYNSDTIN